jgi:hypothetical protein
MSSGLRNYRAAGAECNSAFWRETVNRRAVLALRQPAELALRARCVAFFDDARE